MRDAPQFAWQGLSNVLWNQGQNDSWKSSSFSLKCVLQKMAVWPLLAEIRFTNFTHKWITTRVWYLLFLWGNSIFSKTVRPGSKMKSPERFLLSCFQRLPGGWEMQKAWCRWEDLDTHNVYPIVIICVSELKRWMGKVNFEYCHLIKISSAASDLC